jgi:hypothetical protein
METTLAVLAHAGWGWWWIFPLTWIALIALFWTFAWRGPWRRRAEPWHETRAPEAVLGAVRAGGDRRGGVPQASGRAPRARLTEGKGWAR